MSNLLEIPSCPLLFLDASLLITLTVVSIGIGRNVKSFVHGLFRSRSNLMSLVSLRVISDANLLLIPEKYELNSSAIFLLSFKGYH